MRIIAILFFVFKAAFIFCQTTPLPNAHAHNDYAHKRPLQDALSHGFTSIEVDIHLIDNELYVSHDRPLTKKAEKTLINLYLKPLQEIIRQHNGRVYQGYSADFFLLIDIKTDADATYQVLKKQLAAFSEMLTIYEDGIKKQGAVTVFLSGNRPIEMVQQESYRQVAIDGRPPDVGEYDANLMPVISDHYKNHLSWRGRGRLKKEEVEKLEQWIEQAHRHKQLVRLWASPEKKKVWEKLLEIGVDLLNTDRLDQLQSFLLARQ